jgi:hypothetical protein
LAQKRVHAPLIHESVIFSDSEIMGPDFIEESIERGQDRVCLAGKVFEHIVGILCEIFLLSLLVVIFFDIFPGLEVVVIVPSGIVDSWEIFWVAWVEKLLEARQMRRN